MAKTPLHILVLAAGEGTRMRSSMPKVMHEVAGLPLLIHVLNAAKMVGAQKLSVIVGPGREDVKKQVRQSAPASRLFVQKQRLGTGHAVLQARAALQGASGQLIVAAGDTPLLRPESFQAIAEKLAAGADVVVGAFETPQPEGYGRILTKGVQATAIVEEKEASAAQKKITLVNSGIIGFRSEKALQLVKAIGRSKHTGEYYLTDAIAIAHGKGLRVEVANIPMEDTLGVNTRMQLSDAEKVMQQRLRKQAMENGATLIAPETVFLSHDTQLGEDVVVHPHVVFGKGVVVESGAQVLSFSHLEGARVGKNARIGPFARLRPGTKIGAGAHIGNFVEVNRSTIAGGVDANHLSYIGDAEVGKGTNIGAGTITCNFDGANKHKTKIGQDVFIGSNSTLIAPLKIGDEALVAAGSTIQKNVPPGGLVFGRVKEQVVKPKQGALKIRANKKTRAARKAKQG